MKSNPIPPEYPSWNTFMQLHDQNQERLKVLLKELADKDEAALSGEEKKVADFYSSAMDEAAIEARLVRSRCPARRWSRYGTANRRTPLDLPQALGTAPLAPLLRVCEEAPADLT